MTDTIHAQEHLHTITVDSPVDELRLVASERGLRAVLWLGHDVRRVPTLFDADTAGGVGVRGGAPLDEAIDESSSPILEQAATQLEEYFAGTREMFDVPLDPIGSPFQQSVWAVLRTIPYGTTMTYGEQATRLGDPNKARAVGAANGRNPLSIVVPCHRVIGASGKLTGFAGGLDNKAWLLAHEQRTLL